MAFQRWLRRRAACYCITCIACCGVFVFIVTSLRIDGRPIDKIDHCTDEESKQLIQDLCELYKKRAVAGSLCSALCDSGNFQYDSCTNYRQGKKVLFMTYKSRVPGQTAVSVVFKMKTRRADRILFNNSYDHLTTGQRKKAYLEEVKTLVKNTFAYNVYTNMAEHKDILSYAWGWNVQNFLKNGGNVEDAVVQAVSSILSLIEQPEYLMSRYLYNYTFIPVIYGTCGPAYLVENTPTLANHGFEASKGWTLSWKERVSIALKLIELMKQMDTMSQKLHLCDIKPENFGLRANGNVTLIDADFAIFEQGLMNQFKHSNCSSHADCDFNDCRGFCDLKNNQCMKERTNNNMQSLCEDVFVGYFPKMTNGLLKDPPRNIKVPLLKLLQECSSPQEETKRHTARKQTDPDVVKALQELLLQSIRTL